MEHDVGKYIKAYRDLRARAAQIDAAAKAKIAPLNEAMQKIENYLLELSAKQGVQSFNTPFGTAYRNKVNFIHVSDWQAFLTYVRKHEAWDLLMHGAAKAQVLALVDEGVPGVKDGNVPGVDIRREIAMGFRAPTKVRSQTNEQQRDDGI